MSLKASTNYLKTPEDFITELTLKYLRSKPISSFNVPGVDVNDPVAVDNVRQLQARGFGSVANMVGLGLLGGGAYGLIRRRGDLKKTKEELDKLESTRSSITYPVKQASSPILDGIVDFVKAGPTAAWDYIKGLASVDAETAGKYDVPFGFLPKGWVVPAVGIGVPAAVIAGDRIADVASDKIRAKMIKERKEKLKSQFSRLLSKKADRGSSVDVDIASCEEFLDFVAPKAASMITKTSRMSASTATLGALQGWWILSSLLAWNRGKAIAKRDPAAAEYDELKKFEAESELGKPVRFRVVGGRDAFTPSRVAYDNPFTLAYPQVAGANVYKQADSWLDDKLQAGKKWLVDTAFDQFKPQIEQKAQELVSNNLGIDLKDPQQVDNVRSAVNFMQSAGSAWNKLKSFGTSAWNVIQPAIEKFISGAGNVAEATGRGAAQASKILGLDNQK